MRQFFSKNFRPIIGALIFVFFIANSTAVFAYSLKELIEQRLDPDLEYQTIETAHFHIHFPTQLQTLASEIAVKSEIVHERVYKWLGASPNSPTHIVLYDKSDQPIIFAFTHPHAQVFFDVSLPHMGTGLNDYAQWHEWLLTHEYTHIIQMDHVLESQRWMNVLGAWLKPNRLSPRWLKEGLAVKAETELTPYGRGKGTFYESVIRAAVATGQLRNPDYIDKDNFHNERYKQWPWPNRGYIFGELLINTLLQQSSPSCLIDGLAANPPLFLTPAIKKCGYESFDALWEDALQLAEHDANIQLAQIRKHPVSEFELLTNDGFWYAGLTMSQDSKLLAVTRDDPVNGKQLLMLKNIDNVWSDVHTVTSRTTGYHSSISRSGRFIAFDQSFWRPGNYLRSDISIFDLKTKSYISQSKDLRARDVTIHPDGYNLAYVRNVAGKNVLETSNSGFGQRRILLSDLGYRRISSPTYSPDGLQLAVVIHNDDSGAEEIWLIDSMTGTKSILIANGARNRDPHWSHDGHILYYSSDRNGVFNAHALDLEIGRNYQISNVEGGLLWPNVDNSGLWLYGLFLGDNGYNVGRMELDRELWLIVKPESSYEMTKQESHESNDVNISSPSKYKGFAYLTPQYIQPHLSFRPESLQAGFKFGSVDPLYFQHYEIAIREDFDTDEIVGEAFYFNGQNRTALDASIKRDVFRINANDQIKDVLYAEINANVFLNNRNTLFFRPGISYSKVQFNEEQSHIGFNLGLRFDTEFTQIGYSFPESGKFIDAELSFNNGLEGAQNYWSFKGHLARHWPMSKSRHALHLNADLGWLSTGLEDNQFGIGGEAIFPDYLPNNFELIGVEPNQFLVSKLASASLMYTYPISDLQISWRGPRLTAGRLSGAFIAQTAWFEDPGVIEETDNSVGLGFELIQDINFADQFDLQVKLGLYRSENDVGGDSRIVFGIVGLPFIRSESRR